MIWLDAVSAHTTEETLRRKMEVFRDHLQTYALADCIAVCYPNGTPVPKGIAGDCLGLGDAAEADVLLNQRYKLPSGVVRRFRRSALLDIDPGLTQVLMT
ncbi:MAG: hypothetical protein ABIU86_14845 [Gemmatimonadaceae bacterium]